MNLNALIQLLLYILLLSLGFYYLEQDKILMANFWEAGWQNYDGPDIDSPENSFYGISGLLTFLNGLWVLFRFWSGKQLFKLEIIQGLLAILLSMVFGVLYSIDGDASMKESFFFWVFALAMQIILNCLIIFHKYLATSIHQRLKYLYGGNAVTYTAALALGYVMWEWDNAILTIIESVGSDNYRGIDKDNPENYYHLSLIILNSIALIFSWWDRAKKRPQQAFKGLALLFLIYSIFVFINDGNPDMTETAIWWNVLSLSMIVLSAYLFYITKDNRPKESDPAILDDF